MSKKTVSVISDIVYVISTTIFFIILIITYSKISGSDYAYMYSIGANWGSGPISSFNTTGDMCGAGESPLISESWPGTVEGCYCRVSFGIYGPLRIGQCRRKRDNFIFCSNVHEVSAIPYSIWRGKTFCGERATTTYLDMNIATSEKECPKNTRSCGIVDSLNNVMCVPLNAPCPMNFIKTLPSGAQIPTDMQYSVLDLNGEQMLVSNQDTTGKILNEFIVSDAQPCANPGYKNYVVPAYKLDPYYGKDKCNDKIGNYTYDNRYYEVDTYNSYKLMKENNIIPVIINLPLYPNQMSQQHEVYLYARNYIGLNPVCLKEIQQNGNSINLINDLYDIDSNISAAVTLSLISMIIGIFMFALALFFFIFACIIGFQDDYLRKMKIIWYILPLIFTVICLILCSIVVTKTNNYHGDISYLTRKDCVDDITYQAANSFNNNVGVAKILSIISVALLVLLTSIPIAEFISYYFC